MDENRLVIKSELETSDISSNWFRNLSGILQIH